MSGAPDLLYVRARSALLEVAEALAEQLEAVSQFAPRHGPERSVPRCRPMGPSQPRESAPSVSHSRSNRARRMLSE